jgi:hypothetical protein
MPFDEDPGEGAPISASEFAQMCDEMKAKDTRIAQLEARLEVRAEPGVPDGIETRDATIRLLDAKITQLGGAISNLLQARSIPPLSRADLEAHLRETLPEKFGVDDDAQAAEWCFKDCRWAYALAVQRMQDA